LIMPTRPRRQTPPLPHRPQSCRGLHHLSNLLNSPPRQIGEPNRQPLRHSNDLDLGCCLPRRHGKKKDDGQATITIMTCQRAMPSLADQVGRQLAAL